MKITLGLAMTFFTLALISLLDVAYEKMKWPKSSMHVMMGLAVATFLKNEQHTKFSIQGITSPISLRMWLSMLKGVIVANEWEDLPHQTKCPYNLK